MTDFNTPILTTNKDLVLDYLNNKIASIAKLDYAGDTNVPVNAMRWNNTGKYLERFNGTTWVAQGYGLLSSSAVSSATISNDAINNDKILLNNNGFLRAKKADGTPVGVVGLDASNDLVVSGYGSGVKIYNSGVYNWLMGSHLVPQNANQNVGSSSSRIGTLFSDNVAAYGSIKGYSGGANLVLDTATSGGAHIFKQGGSDRWTIEGNTLRNFSNGSGVIGSGSAVLNNVFSNAITSYTGANLALHGSLAIAMVAGGIGIANFVSSPAYALLPANTGRYLGYTSNAWAGLFVSEIGSASLHVNNIYAAMIRNENALDFYSKNNQTRFFAYGNVTEPHFAIASRTWWDGARGYPYFNSTTLFGVGDTFRVSGGTSGEAPDAWLRIEVGSNQYYAIKLWTLAPT